ncbi:MAG: hypothetical protein ABIO81_06135 [Ginsengibacter sp.]
MLFTLTTSIPSSVDIWSNEGMIPHSDSNLTYGVFPNILDHYDSPSQIKFFIVILSILSIFFTLGYARQLASILLWYGWACLLNRNNLTLNPSIPYIGWLLLANCFIPPGETLSITKTRADWELPKLLLVGAWIIFVLGYFFSGIDKLRSASWIEGTALKQIMECPLGNRWDGIIGIIPDSIFQLLNWLIIIAELLCLPFAVFKTTRKWAWMLATFIQLGIFLSLNIYPIFFGMLTIHLFLYNREWFPRSFIHFKKIKRIQVIPGNG